ncbi:SDR family oxidoreductase [Nakamurella sp. YIM 132087]|uniref:SDR family oxidoreductase n=1 Tax=Nakamurella alba TaxID=2665158 RepID=A0A7K1FH17_9ACTN|nr:SDR family oxidoreductase [Nakamurella alba]MTD13412.1 SDR family oxidoreductase [Nakamurella alba]
MNIFPGRFTDRVLFATGAASGIAQAAATRWTAEGGRVAVVDLDQARADAAAAELPGAIGLAADVSDQDSVRAAVDAAVAQLGRIDGVLNAAGHVDFGDFDTYGYDTWRRTMDVHAGGAFLVTQAAAPALRASGSGAVVNVASIAALTAQPGNFAYGAAKAAVIGFTQQIALDLAPDIRVNVVIPGRTRSGMTTPLYTARGNGDYAAGAAMSADRNMQGRVAEPEELAAAILFLLSTDASFVTGSGLVVDGGEILM